MKYFRFSSILSAIVLIISVQSCQSGRNLPVVDDLDLEKYAGTWYDIAHLPQKFQAGCKCVTAEYTAMESYVKVVNTCVDVEDDEVRKVEGKAFTVSDSSNAILEVQFFWPFRGDYYIIGIDEYYQMALVGAPNREYLWLLSRDAAPNALLMKEFLQKARDLGFDIDALEFTDQSCNLKPVIKE